jgi:hypothetical protein
MQPLKYIISNNGSSIAVGVVGNKQTALEEATLAENIYGINHSDHLFDHLMYFPSIKSLKKFFILKEYFTIWDEHWTRNRVAKTKNKAQIISFTRRAIKRGKLVMEGQVSYENFIYQISIRNQEFTLGCVHAENLED